MWILTAIAILLICQDVFSSSLSAVKLRFLDLISVNEEIINESLQQKIKDSGIIEIENIQISDHRHEAINSVVQSVTRQIMRVISTENMRIHQSVIFDKAQVTPQNCDFVATVYISSSSPSEKSFLVVLGNQASSFVQPSTFTCSTATLQSIASTNYVPHSQYTLPSVATINTTSTTTIQSISRRAYSNDDNTFCDVGQQSSMNMVGFFSISEKNTPCIILLFPDWLLDSSSKFSVAVLGSFLFGILMQFLSNYKHFIKGNPQKCFEFFRTMNSCIMIPVPLYPRVHTLSVILLFATETVCVYFAMLIAMTYNMELFIALLVGMVFGLLYVQYNFPKTSSSSSNNNNNESKYGTEGEEDEKTQAVRERLLPNDFTQN